MSSKTVRNRNKRRKANGFDLAPVPQRKSRGRARMTQIKHERDADNVVLTARARMMGSDKPAEMKDTALVDDAGAAIRLSCDQDAANELVALWRAYTGSYERYSRTCLGLSAHARTAKIEMMPETMETRADDRPDLRSEEERHRDAQNSWARYSSAFAGLHKTHRLAINTARIGAVDLVHAGTVTGAGKRFIVAIRKFSEVAGRVG